MRDTTTNRTIQLFSALTFAKTEQAGPRFSTLISAGPKKKDFDTVFNMDRGSAPSPTLSRTSTAVEARGNVKYVFRSIPARIAVAITSTVLFITALAMFIVGIIVAKALRARLSIYRLLVTQNFFVVGNLGNLQRLAVFFQVVNYSLVMVISIIGYVTSTLLASLPSDEVHVRLVACIRRSLRLSQAFTGLLIAQLPFGIVAGALAMRMIFKGINSASDTSGASFDTVCAGSLESLAFICNDINSIKPAVVLSFLEFWFWEMRRYCHRCDVLFY